MSETVISRSGRVFVGMVYTDSNPCKVSAERPDYVKRVHMFDVPTTLRTYACTFLDGEAADETWWTVGEFRYVGEDYITAFACRVYRDGRIQVDYGIEREETDPWESALLNVRVPMPTGLSGDAMVTRHIRTCAAYGRGCVVCESV